MEKYKYTYKIQYFHIFFDSQFNNPSPGIELSQSTSLYFPQYSNVFASASSLKIRFPYNIPTFLQRHIFPSPQYSRALDSSRENSCNCNQGSSFHSCSSREKKRKRDRSNRQSKFAGVGV